MLGRPHGNGAGRVSRGGFLVLLAMLLAPTDVGAQRQERATGAQRTCTYPAGRILGPRLRERTLLVGRGEPCPATFPRPTVRGEPVPSLATLAGTGRQGGRVQCRYAYGGRLYTVERPGGACPLTPNVF